MRNAIYETNNLLAKKDRKSNATVTGETGTNPPLVLCGRLIQFEKENHRVRRLPKSKQQGNLPVTKSVIKERSWVSRPLLSTFFIGTFQFVVFQCIPVPHHLSDAQRAFCALDEALWCHWCWNAHYLATSVEMENKQKIALNIVLPLVCFCHWSSQLPFIFVIKSNMDRCYWKFHFAVVFMPHLTVKPNS